MDMHTTVRNRTSIADSRTAIATVLACLQVSSSALDMTACSESQKLTEVLSPNSQPFKPKKKEASICFGGRSHVFSSDRQANRYSHLQHGMIKSETKDGR
jgi:hypothetical protein